MRYRVDIKDRQIVDCYKITKKHHPVDYAFVQQYRSFAHIDFTTKNIKAFLLYAPTSDDAKIKAILKLRASAGNMLVGDNTD